MQQIIMLQKHRNDITQNKLKEVKTQVWLPLTTSDLEKEWAYSQRKKIN